MAGLYTKGYVRKLTRRFGITPIKFGWRPSIYRKQAVIRVRTDTGAFALKPFYRSTSFPSGTVEQMKTAAKHAEWLTSSGYSYMPRWLYADSGKLWIVSKGRPFYMTEWITGRGLEGAGDFANLGRAIATLHHTSSELLQSQESDSFTRKQLGLWKLQERRLLHDKVGALRNAKLRRWFRKYGEDCRSLSERSWAEMNDPEIAALLDQESSRPALIHGDITSTNVMISDDDRLYILDWDRVKIGSIYIELAKTLANTAQFNPEFLQSLLNGYEEIRPLTRTERRLIAALFRFPREAWTVACFPKRKSSSALIDILDGSWGVRLNAVGFLDAWANPVEESGE